MSSPKITRMFGLLSAARDGVALRASLGPARAGNTFRATPSGLQGAASPPHPASRVSAPSSRDGGAVPSARDARPASRAAAMNPSTAPTPTQDNTRIVLF